MDWPGTPPSCVLLTGATGFVGQALHRRLHTLGIPVRVLSRRAQVSTDAPSQFWHKINPLEEAPFALYRALDGVEAVFHLAAKTSPSGPYSSFYNANVVFTKALLQAARHARVPYFIYTSSPSVVFNGQSIAGGNESLPYTQLRFAAYAHTKALAEAAVLQAHTPDLGFQTLALRPHLVWGNRDPQLLGRLLARAKMGRLIQVGSGQNRVDITHVDNAVAAHCLALQALQKGQGGGQAYFLGQETPVFLWDWIKQLLSGYQLAGPRRRIPFSLAYGLGRACEMLDRLRGYPSHAEPLLTRFVACQLAQDHFFDHRAAQDQLGYRPEVSIQVGLERLWSEGLSPFGF